MSISRNKALGIAFGVLLIGGVGAAAAYEYKDYFAAPCEAPLTYSVGSIDPRFGISDEELAAVLSEAAAVWNTAAGKEVLRLSDTGDLPVHLVYDERQATAELGEEIDSDQARYDALKRQIDSLIASHESKIRAHDASVATFERRTAAYEASVDRWNREGGAPPREYERLEAERKSLARLQTSINESAERLNGMTSEINEKVAELNQMAETLNLQVDTYNTVAGTEFDQGQYIEDAKGARITIYEFRTREQLARALAHEFGHALGIEHTDDPQSLMYPYNSGDDLTLSAEDIGALIAACELS